MGKWAISRPIGKCPRPRDDMVGVPFPAGLAGGGGGEEEERPGEPPGATFVRRSRRRVAAGRQCASAGGAGWGGGGGGGGARPGGGPVLGGARVRAPPPAAPARCIRALPELASCRGTTLPRPQRDPGARRRKYSPCLLAARAGAARGLPAPGPGVGGAMRRAAPAARELGATCRAA